jgi:hypothetical protein
MVNERAKGEQRRVNKERDTDPKAVPDVPPSEVDQIN